MLQLKAATKAMERHEVLAAILKAGIVPVVRTATAESALHCIEAIHRGGIGVVEITMTVPGALRVLELVADEFGDGDRVLLGAGTVLDPETARACMLAGAAFILTPTLNPATIELVRGYSKVILAGALTPAEVLKTWESGADVVRVLPCDAMGGASYIRSLRAPFPHIDLMAIGGVTLETVSDYFRAGAVGVGVAGALIDSSSLRSGSYEVFTERARRFVESIRRVRESLAAHPPL
jgi:2-dehydro-3-deoxyphosphogluconate aldolase/(4S)-4-hydroxy-2-oxoglutarate aldolase